MKGLDPASAAWNLSRSSTRALALPPARAIQEELAGHVDLSTTQRYMHLTPTALENAMRLLEPSKRGGIRETANG